LVVVAAVGAGAQRAHQVVAILGTAAPTLKSGYWPWDLLKLEWRLFLSHPLLGVGPGNPTWFLAARSGGDSAVHATMSWYLGTLAETGVVGFVALVAFLYGWYSRFRH